jgi:hypothetical protein
MHDTKQVYYNNVKGEISEINSDSNFPSVVLQVGHENKRYVNLCLKPDLLEEIVKKYSIGDRITMRFFISSRHKHGRWYTMANALQIVDSEKAG